jgi:hypothetical protein
VRREAGNQRVRYGLRLLEESRRLEGVRKERNSIGLLSGPSRNTSGPERLRLREGYSLTVPKRLPIASRPAAGLKVSEAVRFSGRPICFSEDSCR